MFDLLVRYEDLVGRDEVCQRDGLVGLPLLHSLDVIDEDDEVLGSTLVVDLGCRSSALDHFGDVVYVVYVG